MYIQTLMASLAQIALMIGLGYYMRKKSILSADHVKGLSNLLLSVVLPLSILSSGYQKYTLELGKSLLLTLGIVLAYYILSLLVSHLLFALVLKDKGYRGVSVTMTVFANTGFMGFPLVLMLYGSVGVLYAAVYNLLYGLFQFSFGVKEVGSGNVKVTWSDIFQSPVTISSFLSVVLFVVPWKVPSFVQAAFVTVGGMTAPISMFIVGAWMVGVNWKRIFLSKFSYLIVFIRLLAYPLLMLFILHFFNLPVEMFGTIVLITALPIGSLNVILAEKYGADVTYVNETMLLSLILSLVTIPSVMMLVQAV